MTARPFTRTLLVIEDPTLLVIEDPADPLQHRLLLTRAEAGQLLAQLPAVLAQMDTQVDTLGYTQTTPSHPNPPQSASSERAASV